MTDTSLIFESDSGGGHFKVQIDGLTELIRGLKRAEPEMNKALKKALKEASAPVLKRARANARAIADDGTLEGSLSIASRKGGAMYILKSTDEAAPIKEYAAPGAVATRSYKRTPRSLSMVEKRSRVGVPNRANAPRVMVPAVADSAEEVKSRIDEAMDDALKELANG